MKMLKSLKEFKQDSLSSNDMSKINGGSTHYKHVSTCSGGCTDTDTYSQVYNPMTGRTTPWIFEGSVSTSGCC